MVRPPFKSSCLSCCYRNKKNVLKLFIPVTAIPMFKLLYEMNPHLLMNQVSEFNSTVVQSTIIMVYEYGLHIKYLLIKLNKRKNAFFECVIVILMCKTLAELFYAELKESERSCSPNFKRIVFHFQ